MMITRELGECFAYVETLRETVPLGLHPAVHNVIRDWLGEMYLAADRGDMAEFARLAKRVQDRVGQEYRSKSDDEE